MRHACIQSWGLPGPFVHRVLAPGSLAEIELPRDDLWLAHGNSRSYGDVALNVGHTLVHTRWLDRYLAFDDDAGVLECESGVLLSRIVADFMPRGWFPPVVPGTRHVSVGGAVANDVHGKNHHAMGSFGDHVLGLRLRRSDGAEMYCSSTENAEWFASTIGGLGLTGLITSVRLRLRPITSGWMSVNATRFRGLDDFFELNSAAESAHEYAVSWIDCLSGGDGLRGVLFAGDHAPATDIGRRERYPSAPTAHAFPLTPPVSLVNGMSLRAFNTLYFHKAPAKAHFLQGAWQYFWPLDAVEHWNRMYGRRGLLQYQFVVPPESARETISEVLALIREAGTGSFLAVLKTFGRRVAPGMLSFPRCGLTLALDFPNHPGVHALFSRLDTCILAAGGALYPAKDAIGSSTLFRAGYPGWAEFQRYRDPCISSTFVRRMEAS